MIFNNSCIESFGHHLPTNYFSSDDIEQKLSPLYDRLKLPYGRLFMQTGIEKRGYWEPGTKPSDIAAAAAEDAFERASIDRKDVEVLIHASVCRDFLEPATASVVHNKLGLNPSCTIFDLSNACLGVLNSMVMIANMIELGQIKCGMVVSGENSGPLLAKTIDFLLSNSQLNRKSIKKYFANLTIGSAGVACILTHDSISKSKHKLLGGTILSDTTASVLCQGDGDTDGLMMETDSEALMKAGVKLAAENWNRLKKELDWNNNSADKIVGHQVGIAHRVMMLKTLELDEQKDFSTFSYLGNTGSAALPVTLSIGDREGIFEKNNILALLGIGSGLNTIMLGVKW